jgi:hypothetical protein
MPRMLDVVWCMFPEQEKPNQPGPKPRPALVRAVFLYHNQTRAAVEVTYGTSRISQLHALDLQISNLEAMNDAGLFQATGFRLSKTLKLPWAEEFFVPRDGERTPIIGHLNHQSVAQLEALKVARRGKNVP